MIRFITYALPLLLLLLATFGFVVDVLDLSPRSGAVMKLAVLEQPQVPAPVVLGTWMMEACGLLALFLVTQGRCGAWWLDGLVAGSLAWIFRGPLLVMTIVVAVRQPQDPWWDIALGWWILYSICGLSLALLAKKSGVVFEADPEISRQEASKVEESAEEIRAADEETRSSGESGDESSADSAVESIEENDGEPESEESTEDQRSSEDKSQSESEPDQASEGSQDQEGAPKSES